MENPEEARYKEEAARALIQRITKNRHKQGVCSAIVATMAGIGTKAPPVWCVSNLILDCDFIVNRGSEPIVASRSVVVHYKDGSGAYVRTPKSENFKGLQRDNVADFRYGVWRRMAREFIPYVGSSAIWTTWEKPSSMGTVCNCNTYSQTRASSTGDSIFL